MSIDRLADTHRCTVAYLFFSLSLNFFFYSVFISIFCLTTQCLSILIGLALFVFLWGRRCLLAVLFICCSLLSVPLCRYGIFVGSCQMHSRMCLLVWRCFFTASSESNIAVLNLCYRKIEFRIH